MPKISKLLLIGAAAVVLSGCSTIRHGPYEKITITSTPEASLCKIYREGHGYLKSVSTPDARYILRDTAPVTIVCSKSGYKTTSITVAPSWSEQEDTDINNFATAGLGFVLDNANFMRQRLPETIHVDLEQQ